MTSDIYNELMEELNFYDESVGIRQTTLLDKEVLEDIIKDFNYDPLGYYEHNSERVYQFKGDDEVYIIKEVDDNLKIYQII